MKVTATTLPRSSRSESRALSCVVSVNSGAGPIFDSRASAFASWAVAGPTSPTATTVANMAKHHARHRPILALQLPLELVGESPVSVLRNEPLRAALQESGFVETERVEAKRVSSTVLAPLAVGGDLLEGLQRIVITIRKPPVHELLGHPLRLERTYFTGLDDCPERSL